MCDNFQVFWGQFFLFLFFLSLFHPLSLLFFLFLSPFALFRSSFFLYLCLFFSCALSLPVFLFSKSPCSYLFSPSVRYLSSNQLSSLSPRLCLASEDLHLSFDRAQPSCGRHYWARIDRKQCNTYYTWYRSMISSHKHTKLKEFIYDICVVKHKSAMCKHKPK